MSRTIEYVQDKYDCIHLLKRPIYLVECVLVYNVRYLKKYTCKCLLPIIIPKVHVCRDVIQNEQSSSKRGRKNVITLS